MRTDERHDILILSNLHYGRQGHDQRQRSAIALLQIILGQMKQLLNQFEQNLLCYLHTNRWIGVYLNRLR